MKHIAAISLSGYNQIADRSFDTLAGMKELKILQFPNSQLTDSQVNKLAKSKSLSVLIFQNGVASATAIQAFKESLPDCEVIVED